MNYKHILIILTLLIIPINLSAKEGLDSRFFYSGDGRLNLYSTKTNLSFNGTYRSNGNYDEKAIQKIEKLYGASKGKMSLRFIEFLDYLEDHFKSGKIIIESGYRSPEYNTSLRNKGKLAAKASLHQYGMAADFKMQGVPPEKIWKYVQDLKFGGAGFYYGQNVHIDIGPARWWDSNTSGVGSGAADDNKLIIINTDKDIYLPGENIDLRFARMTAWPISIKKKFILERVDKNKKRKFEPLINNKIIENKCHVFEELEPMLNLTWKMPKNTKPGRYKVTVEFCNKACQEMPNKISTSIFEIK